MFFYIGPESPIDGLIQVDDNLFLDKGWSRIKNSWIKGYSTECNLNERIHDILDGYKPIGKWCVIDKQENHYNIYHPVLRGFPIYKKDEEYTNLKIDGFELENYFESFQEISSVQISIQEASEKIHNILIENTTNFLKYNEVPVNILYSAGLDTLTSWAIFDSITKNYTLDIYLPKDTDDSLVKIIGRQREYENALTTKVSKDYWGYNICSFYKNENWYLTGYYAEMIQFRDAEAINALANFNDKQIDQVAEPYHYLYWFLKRNTLDKYKTNKIHFTDEGNLRKFLLSTILYDFQYWHLDTNFGFSPFYDHRISMVINQLSLDDILLNAVDGTIQKNIVRKVNPSYLTLLSDYKNEKDVWGNFRKNWGEIKLDKKVKINLR